uniref:Uncharacterized protein n=1 Tax=Megaselia scalaris TaxID=36166 RepID=T1H3Z0_MEGSC
IKILFPDFFEGARRLVCRATALHTELQSSKLTFIKERVIDHRFSRLEKRKGNTDSGKEWKDKEYTPFSPELFRDFKIFISKPKYRGGGCHQNQHFCVLLEWSSSFDRHLAVR